MPESADRISRRQHKIGFKRALPRHPAVQVMFCSLIQSPSTFLAVTWLFTGGHLKARAASIPSIERPEMTSIFAGESSRLDGSLLSVRLPSYGTTGVLLFAL